MKKKGAIELSIGTIVILVLSMAMLVGGLVLIEKIFGSAGGAIDETDQAIRDQLTKTLGEDKEVSVYPRKLDIKIDSEDEIAIRIKNLREDSGDKEFTYEIVPSELDDCEMSKEEILDLMKGEEGAEIFINPGEDVIERVQFLAPAGTQLCSFKIRVNVQYGGETYDSDNIFINIKG